MIPYDLCDPEEDRILHDRSIPPLPRAERMRVIFEKINLNGFQNGKLQEHVFDLVNAYPSLFYVPADEFPKITLAEHFIPTTDNIPVIKHQRRHPLAHHDIAREYAKKLKETDVITESNSPYNAPALIIPNKPDQYGNKQWRMVIDFRALNEKTVGDAYPLPNIAEILDQFGGTKYFSVFDLASGFYQIPMHPADREKTAFTTPERHYEFLRMPMGLKGAPATFQRLMDRVLLGLQGTELFFDLDDIIVYAK